MTDLSVEDYSEKCIVVRGDTKPYKQQLKQLGGKWNSRLRDGAGWIFPKRIEDDVLAFVSSGHIPDSNDKSDMIEEIEKMFKHMNTEKRLQFVARVAMLASVGKPSCTKPSYTKPSYTKPSYTKSDDIIIIDDSDDEQEVPRKRLLK